MLARKDFFGACGCCRCPSRNNLKHSRFRFLFVLASHGITVLWGASGSGKTTLLQCLAGLLRPDAGRIACREAVWFDAERGVCLAPERRRLGYVFRTSGCSRICPCARICCSGGGSGARPGYRSKTWSRFWVWDGCCTARLPICPEAKNSVSPWGAPCWPVPSCCSWTNR